ncbi:MAG: class II apurinic/apyrimidinic(AP)-endonuclease [Solumvirus sp.]|uniref:Class II apurinic/apyrimidinic(AP)-endonuclease n=1 Tax=Solumvirus sp. TaxID=2487773 RepID=A0A3G5AGY5_9VIRU|nr:MAG: class II apurinic/apyrimidinic(AP)-endonuclease [Solumvirus sp.]
MTTDTKTSVSIKIIKQDVSPLKAVPNQKDTQIIIKIINKDQPKDSKEGPSTSNSVLNSLISNKSPPNPSSISKSLRLVSWNIDRMNESKWYIITSFLNKECPAVFCINEIKMSAKKLIDTYLSRIKGYKYIVNDHSPSQYHGVAMLIREDLKYTPLVVNLGCSTRSDNKSDDPAKGRIIAIELESKINVVSCYTPNAGTGLKFLEYRIGEWNPAFYKFLNKLKESSPTVWLGDVNIAPEEIDVTAPKAMSSWAGFTMEERKSHRDFLGSGEWLDLWRFKNPDKIGYTWFSKGGGSKMRLDAVICSKDLLDKVKNVDILDLVGSDHFGLNVDFIC